MILNKVKLHRTDIFINYVASVFSLPVPNLLKLPQLAENELDKTF